MRRQLSARMRFAACAVMALGLLTLAACGGGDDDDDDADAQGNGGSTAESPTQASSGGNGNGGSSGGGGGTATVDITGVESFTFDIKCSFGTGIIEGPGTRNDGEPAYLRGGVGVSDSGAPLETAEAVGFGIKVGIAQLAGQADYEWVVGETAGRREPVSNDGESVSGSAGFEYRDDRAEPRFGYGEVKDGTFEMTCP